MTKTMRLSMFMLIGAPFLLAACLTSPFLRDDGPVRLDGATVSLDRQRCNYDPSWARPEQTGGELVLWIRLTVANDSAKAFTVSPSELRLQGTNIDRAAGPELPEGEGAFTLAPTLRRTVTATFRQVGDLSCATPLALSLDHFVQAGGTPVPLPRLAFVADARGP